MGDQLLRELFADNEVESITDQCETLPSDGAVSQKDICYDCVREQLSGKYGVFMYVSINELERKSLWASRYRNGFAHHRSLVQDPVGMVLSTELPTINHHNSINLSVRWCVWKVGEEFVGRVSPKT